MHKNILILFSVQSNEVDCESLADRVRELETTLHYVCWHDHSDLLAHSYYVIAVWFIYDTAVYLTDAEAGNGYVM